MSIVFVVCIILIPFLGVGLILLLIAWPITMVWGALSAGHKHRQFMIWQTQYPR